MGSRFGSRHVLGVREQLGRLRGACPGFRSRVRGALLIADGDVRPTARSVVYRVKIEYRVGDAPQIFVLSPKLEPREPGGRIPHVCPGNRLCLYLPGADEWTSEMSLAHTIIPWISEWLFFYETWHAIGVWLGGGVEPSEHTTIRREEKEKPYEHNSTISHTEP
jgi:hypothetical protein